MKDAEQQSEANGVGDNDNNVGLQDSVKGPHGDARSEDREHAEREIACMPGLPAFLQLGEVGHGRAKTRPLYRRRLRSP